MAWGLVIAGGSAVVGSYLSYKSSKDAAKAAEQQGDLAEARLARAEDRINTALENLDSLTPPNLMQYVKPYERAVLVGELTPEEAVAKLQEDTALAGIRVPAELLRAQTSALNKIKQIADEGGLTDIDRARIADIKESIATANRGAQEAIVQEAQRRGIAGSGLEQANRLLAQQAAATRGARAGVDVAAEAQRRALDAIMQQGQLSSTMRNQAFSEEARKAEAQDAINRFNTGITNQTNQLNVEARNNAEARNLAERQRIAEKNAALKREEEAARMAAAQDQWQNIMNLSTLRGNLAAGQATGALTAFNSAQDRAAKERARSDALEANAAQQLFSGAGKLFEAYNKP